MTLFTYSISIYNMWTKCDEIIWTTTSSLVTIHLELSSIFGKKRLWFLFNIKRNYIKIFWRNDTLSIRNKASKLCNHFNHILNRSEWTVSNKQISFVNKIINIYRLRFNKRKNNIINNIVSCTTSHHIISQHCMYL